ncbi:diaminopimelate decarboxylase [Peptoclostridium litorale DSM 5388]|uniref:Diaminopimelate decarboxylase n=1 Tax=Peptoclostridium litorale DSM 5388 TaxID=1121324 RepID=A0A069RAJ3_PEPLI|nr:diaminopimelate decarboxylase [Peptoclostridium litorale]KDR94084.1 diaminopimelate decarboxylase LysA [Peptoclostridium litorale DSM 5388]SIN80650.1 diaminopimelate decarboxylase [Peptoclostridium litorale DSM 5388]
MKTFGNYEVIQNSLHLHGHSMKELANEYGTPLYVYDENYIRENARRYRESFEQGKNIVTYAGKAFLTVEMCRLVKEEGLSLDVVSSGELYAAKRAGFPMEKIYFHGNNKTREEIAMAVELGVGRFIADNFRELRLIDEIAGEMGKTSNAILRIAPGIEAHTHEYIKTGMIDTKFGFSIVEKEYLKAAKAAEVLPNVELKGIHCHIGSQIFEVQPFYDAALAMLGILKEINEEIGRELEELDLGGGFGCYYVEGDDPLEIEEYVDIILRGVAEGIEKLGMKEPRLIIEPGRSMVNNAGVNLYTVGAIKEIPGVRKYVSVDGGMTDNIRPALYQAEYTAVIADRVESDEKELVTIAGKCCESGDVLINNIEMAKMEEDDILALLYTGAYGYSMASNYNMLRRPAVIFVSDSGIKTVVKRQTYEDLLMGQE